MDRNETFPIRINFSGASAKARAASFRGWAGVVKQWPERSAPAVDFGKWTKAAGNPWGGGVVEFAAYPGQLIMWGANAPGMDRRDKSTKFGIAGFGDTRELWARALSDAEDAGGIFQVGGRVIPNVEEEVDAIGKLAFDKSQLSLTGTQLLSIIIRAFDKLTLRVPRNPMQGEDIAKLRVEFQGRLPIIREAWKERIPELAALADIAMNKFKEWEVLRSLKKSIESETCRVLQAPSRRTR